MSDLSKYEDELKECRCKWIPISERLPEKDGRYLITTKLEIHDLGPYYAVYTANFDGKYFDIGYIGEGISVIAWMPFPEPYKAKSEVNDGKEINEN